MKNAIPDFLPECRRQAAKSKGKELSPAAVVISTIAVILLVGAWQMGIWPIIRHVAAEDVLEEGVVSEVLPELGCRPGAKLPCSVNKAGTHEADGCTDEASDVCPTGGEACGSDVK